MKVLLYIITLACSLSQTIFSMNCITTDYIVVYPHTNYMPYYNTQTNQWSIRLDFQSSSGVQYTGIINRKQLQNLCEHGTGIININLNILNFMVTLPKNQNDALSIKHYYKKLLVANN